MARVRRRLIPAFFCLANSVLLRFFLVYQLDAQQRDRAVAGITRALEQGELASRIGPTFSLAETAAAHEAVEHGTIGNVIVTIKQTYERCDSGRMLGRTHRTEAPGCEPFRLGHDSRALAPLAGLGRRSKRNEMALIFPMSLKNSRSSPTPPVPRG